MASTTLPNGIIVPEKFSRDWYADLYHNWQELDNLLGGGTPKDGTLTIQKNGDTVGTFSANQATDETINIEVPDVNNGTLTIQKNGDTVGTFSANQATDETIDITVPDVNNGTLTIQQNSTTVDSFSANSSTDKTVNIQCVDLSTAQTIGGVKKFTDGLFTSKSGQGDLAILEDSSINSTNEDTNGMPLAGHTNSIKIKGSQFNVVPCMLTGQLFTNGDTSAELRVYKYKDVKSNAMIIIRYAYANNTGFVQLKNISSIIPGITNTANLGSPSLQWNTTYTRNILIDNDINIASSLINKTSTSGVISIRSGLTTTDGASISLYGKDYGGSSGLVGNIYMSAYGDSDYTSFRIYPSGVIRVYNNSTATTKNVAMQEDTVPRSGGAVFTSDYIGRTANTSRMVYCGGTDTNGGACLKLYGKDSSNMPGEATIGVYDGTNSQNMMLYPSGTWTWSGQPCQTSSDQRLKQQISEIDDKLLDAWQDVDLVQFKYNDAVDQKGDTARLHTGYVVQQIDKACKSHNIDISAYGLFCHEEYPQETEEVEVEQADGTKTKETKVIREASEHYSLRYTEVYAVECMYLRRCIKQLTARIEQLEKGNK